MDYRIPLAGVLIAGGAVGLLLPGHGNVPKSAAGKQPTAVAKAAHSGGEVRRIISATTPANIENPTSGAGWGQPVTLQRQPDGHFYADVMIDGLSYRMLVDTGATMVVLSGDDAQRMGMTWTTDQLRPIVRGADGPIDAVQTTIKQMSVGGIVATNVPAVIIPGASGMSLLGQAFLSRIGNVQIKDNQMLLGS